MSSSIRSLLTFLLATAVAAAALVATSAPSHAAGTPVVLSPTAGQAFATGFTGPITVDFSAMGTPTWYDVEVQGPDGLHHVEQVYGDGQQTFSVPAVETPGSYSIGVVGPGGTWPGVGSFEIFRPTMKLSDVTLSPSTFYPRVRDGYRDRTRFGVTINQPATASMTVKNASGRTVRSWSVGTLAKGRHAIHWSGTDNAGAKVPAGKYSMTFRAKNPDGSTATATRTATVATALVTRTATRTRYAYQASGDTSGSCYVTWYDESVELDCWGGRFAKASFGYSIPSSAWDISWSVAGSRSALDRCCSGTITRSGARVSSTRYRVTAKVTGWRAWDVESATIHYKYKKRI